MDGLGGDEQDAELEGRGAKGFVEDALNSNRAEGETIVALVGLLYGQRLPISVLAERGPLPIIQDYMWVVLVAPLLLASDSRITTEM